MTKKERYSHILNYFQQQMPIAETELTYESPFQLLVAVILSAQCTDKRVNETTPSIFKKFPSPETMALAEFDDLFPLIKSISYPNNKTKHLIGMSQLLLKNFNGEVPMTIDALVTLPGVGRKTANVILNTAFGEPTIAVDTHIFRVSNRTGLAPGKNVIEVEKKLMKRVPQEFIHDAHHWLILHGRYVCKARNPDCAHCVVEPLCSYKHKTDTGKVRGPI